MCGCTMVINIYEAYPLLRKIIEGIIAPAPAQPWPPAAKDQL